MAVVLGGDDPAGPMHLPGTEGLGRQALTRGPGECGLGIPDGAWDGSGGREELFLEVRARDACGWCVHGGVQGMCGAWGV